MAFSDWMVERVIRSMLKNLTKEPMRISYLGYTIVVGAKKEDSDAKGNSGLVSTNIQQD